MMGLRTGGVESEAFAGIALAWRWWQLTGG